MADDPEVTREIGPVDDGPSEADIKVDAALGDLVRCAYHDRWLRALRPWPMLKVEDY